MGNNLDLRGSVHVHEHTVGLNINILIKLVFIIYLNFSFIIVTVLRTLKSVLGPNKGVWRAACGPRAGRCPSLHDLK